MHETDLIGRYLELAAKVDAFFSEVQQRNAALMQCGSGCSDCCARFGVTLVEAAVVAEGVARSDAAVAARMAERARDRSDSRCAALDDQGRCSIYDWRPLICRSHGAPIRQAHPDRPSLPVIDVCPRNFQGGTGEPATADVFDQTTLSTVLGAIDAAFADLCGAPRGTRIELAELLAEPGRYFATEPELEQDADHDDR